MTLCQHVNNVFCTLCNIFWFCHLWLIFMTLLFRKLVNKTDIFLVAFLFLEASTPSKNSEYVLYWWYVNWYFKLWLPVLGLNSCQLFWPLSLVVTWKAQSLYWGVVLKSCAGFLEEHVQPGSVFRSATFAVLFAFFSVSCSPWAFTGVA